MQSNFNKFNTVSFRDRLISLVCELENANDQNLCLSGD